MSPCLSQLYRHAVGISQTPAPETPSRPLLFCFTFAGLLCCRLSFWRRLAYLVIAQRRRWRFHQFTSPERVKVSRGAPGAIHNALVSVINGGRHARSRASGCVALFGCVDVLLHCSASSNCFRSHWHAREFDTRFCSGQPIYFPTSGRFEKPPQPGGGGCGVAGLAAS